MSAGKLVYSKNAELYIRDMDSGETRQYGGVPLMTTPAWHPSGEVIAFGRSSLYLLEVATGRIGLLTGEGSGDTDPAWSPAGDALIFTRLKDVPGLYAMNTEDKAIARIPLDALGARRAFHPAWSPDGGRLAFALDVDGFSQIYTARIDDLFQPIPVVTRLTSGRADSYAPAWSPGGQHLAFASKQDGQWAIYVMDADGGNQRRLTSHPYGDINPCWSPDGASIVFERWDENMKAFLYLMDAHGNHVTALPTEGGKEPDWHE